MLSSTYARKFLCTLRYLSDTKQAALLISIVNNRLRLNLNFALHYCCLEFRYDIIEAYINDD